MQLEVENPAVWESFRCRWGPVCHQCGPRPVDNPRLCVVGIAV